MPLRRAALAAAVLCVACGAEISSGLGATEFDVSTTLAVAGDATPLALAASQAFGDERGGGVFVDVAGRAVRLRIDGTLSRLESHPGNPVTPGPATAAWPLGPFTSLLATSKGLFLSDSGWLIAPPWREQLTAEGFVATAVGDNGVAWVAHAKGLFRIAGGALTELKVEGQSLAGLSGLAVAPAPNGGPAVWFAQGESLSYAEQTGKDAFNVFDSGLPKERLKGGITALAGLTASGISPGELWFITNRTLWRQAGVGFQEYQLTQSPKELKSAGRVLWLRASDDLLRYDAEANTWGKARGLEAVPTLLAADASGAAWVRSGANTLSVSPGVAARVEGLFETQRLYTTDVPVTALLPKASKPTEVVFLVDGLELARLPASAAEEGQGALSSTLFFSLAGWQSSGAPKLFSFATLTAGWHTLEVRTTFEGGAVTRRALHFDFRVGDDAVLSYEKDIKPIHEARCANCHVTGPGRDLSNYQLWKENAALVVPAVVDRRMPADGPLDPVLIQKIQRWANAGALP